MKVACNIGLLAALKDIPSNSLKEYLLCLISEEGLTREQRDFFENILTKWCNDIME